MSDLVERMRDRDNNPFNGGELMLEGAARIEELEALRDTSIAAARIKKLEAENEKLRAMVIEQIQMADQPLEYRLNTVKRAQVLLDALEDKP